MSKKSRNFVGFFGIRQASAPIVMVQNMQAYTMSKSVRALFIALAMSVVALCWTGCGEYQKLLKSKDPEVKYEAALRYFNEGQYVRAQTLLDDITVYYKGTPRSEDIICYLARCYMGNKDYATAAEYYEAYARNYPKGKYIIEARYQIGHAYYMDAPDARLDQEITKKAVKWLSEFVEMFPDSPYAADAYQQMDEMYNRLAQKEYYNAKLYYNLGTYLGNNYLSAEIVAKNAIKAYPGNSYTEELSWIILQAKYQQAVNSFEDKKADRARSTEDEYYNFITDFPASKHRKEAERIKSEVDKMLRK